MAFTTSRIDYENSQIIRASMDTVVMVGPVERFHTSYNKFTRETSPVDGKYYLIRSDGYAMSVYDEDEFNELCFRRGLNLKYSDYSSAGNRSRYFLTRDDAWGSHLGSNGKYTQTITFTLGAEQDNDDLCSIVFDRIDGPVDYEVYPFESVIGTIPAGVHNWVEDIFRNRYSEGLTITITLTAQNEGEYFNCVAAGPGVMAMWTPESLVSADLSLRTTLEPNASGLPASTIDIYAKNDKWEEHYDTSWIELFSAFDTSLRKLPVGSPVTVWQGYKDAKTVDGTTYAAEMVGRRFYFTEDDDLEKEGNVIHLQARDKVNDLENKTTGFAYCAMNGNCYKQGVEAGSWYYGDEKRGPYNPVKGRYGFLMGALYSAIRVAGDDFYIECDDIDDYVHETENPVFSSGGKTCGPYDFQWDDDYYESATGWRDPEYRFLCYIPDRAPRTLLAWAMNVYSATNARVRQADDTKIWRPFAPCYVDAGKPKLTIQKHTSQLTIRETAVTDFQDKKETGRFTYVFCDNYAYRKGGSVAEDELEKIAEKTVNKQTGTYNNSFICGKEPITRVVCKATKRTISSTGEEESSEPPETTALVLSSSEQAAAFNVVGKSLSTYYDPVAREWKERTEDIKVNKVQAFTSSQTLGDTNYIILYEWLAERLQLNETETTWSYGNAPVKTIDYKSYMGKAQMCTFVPGRSSIVDPGSGMTFDREETSGQFTFRGDPRLQPHDVFTFRRIDGTRKDCTIETLDIHYEKGGTTETITYREGIV